MSIIISGDRIIFFSFRKDLPNHSCKLLSLFICPLCKKILKVYFRTDKTIEQWKYEGIEYEGESTFHSIIVPGGQGLVEQTHSYYNSGCSLKIYWALDLRNNLIDWLEEHFSDYQFSSLDKVIELVESGKIEGLYSIPDQYNSQDRLLGYDKSKWEIEWDYGKESYEKWKKRQNKILRQKIKLIGCKKHRE